MLGTMGNGGFREQRVKASELRRQGWAIAAISAELHVAAATVAGWVRDVPGGMQRRPHPQRLARLAEIERLQAEGQARIGELSERDLLVAGTALYAGEGAKTDGVVKFANCDPRMVALFLRWLRRYFTVEEQRLRLRLYLHVGLDLDEALTFWSSLTSIPVHQFGKPYRAVADPTRRLARHPFGCPSITYSCSRTHRAIMGLCSGLLS